MTQRVRSGLRGFARAALIPFLAVVTALAVGAVIILLSGVNPLQAYWASSWAPSAAPAAISETFVWATPYILAGLAVALAFRCGLFNIGVEGQLAIGAVCSVFVGYSLHGLPMIIHLPLALGAGILGGAVWGGIPGSLKARTGAHEVINTIMMNYIALYLINFLLAGPMKDPDPLNAVAKTPLIESAARLPRLIPIVLYGQSVGGVTCALGNRVGHRHGVCRLLVPVEDSSRV